MRVIILTSVLVAAVVALDCSAELDANLSGNFNETIAHAIHSINVEALRLFNPAATEKNVIPTVSLSSPGKVLPYAPLTSCGGMGGASNTKDFATPMMNTIDNILSSIGEKDDSLGPNWSPLERVVHVFHMKDLWQKVKEVHSARVAGSRPSDTLCSCLLDSQASDAPKQIHDAVKWVADHYESGTPITLLNRPIPKLQDASSWKDVWKPRLLHYYDSASLYDAAVYLDCATRHFGKVGNVGLV
jgi:hypothetical protein